VKKKKPKKTELIALKALHESGAIEGSSLDNTEAP